jgi:hypothetical protein
MLWNEAIIPMHHGSAEDCQIYMFYKGRKLDIILMALVLCLYVLMSMNFNVYLMVTACG